MRTNVWFDNLVMKETHGQINHVKINSDLFAPLHTKEPDGVWFDETLGRVWSARPGVPDRRELGRVTLMKKGTKDEAVSCYCCLHGCSVLKRVVRAPDFESISDWYKNGQTLPRTREAAVKARHKALFPAAPE